jgi:hypothetical protein
MVMDAMSASSRVRKRSLMSAVALLCLGVATLLLGFAAAAYADPPTTTPEGLPGWQSSAFTIHLDCSAGTANGDELSVTRYRMDWESAYHEAVWPAGWVGGTLSVMYYFVSQDGIHQFSYYSVGHNDDSDANEQEATKSMPVKIDTSSPTVVVDPTPAGWVGAGQTLSFTATDSASGLQSLNLKVDGAANTWTYGEGTASSAETWSVPAPADHSNDGLHSYEYWATDWVGHESWHDSSSGSFSFGIDTRRPAPTAPYGARVRRGRTAKLFYKTVDLAPNGGTATVTIKVKNLGGTTVKNVTLAGKRVNTLLAWRFRCKLAKRTYKYFVYAIDAAGNTQASVGKNRLVVR